MVLGRTPSAGIRACSPDSLGCGLSSRNEDLPVERICNEALLNLRPDTESLGDFRL